MPGLTFGMCRHDSTFDPDWHGSTLVRTGLTCPLTQFDLMLDPIQLFGRVDSFCANE